MTKRRKRPVKQMIRILERDIQSKVIKYAASKGIHCIRMFFGPGMRVGWPDVLFLIPGGVCLFIEFKAPGKQPTTKQRIKIELLKKMGYMVFICDDWVTGYEIIDACLDASQKIAEAAAARQKA